MWGFGKEILGKVWTRNDVPKVCGPAGMSRMSREVSRNRRDRWHFVFWDTDLFIYLLEPSPGFWRAGAPMHLRCLRAATPWRRVRLPSAGQLLVRTSSCPKRCRITAISLDVFRGRQIRVLKFNLEAAGHYAYIGQNEGVRPPTPSNSPVRLQRVLISSSPTTTAEPQEHSRH